VGKVLLLGVEGRVKRKKQEAMKSFAINNNRVLTGIFAQVGGSGLHVFG
jgi:hypothetical protein